MRKSVTWSVVFALVISLAAPAGAAFGLEEGDYSETEIVESTDEPAEVDGEGVGEVGVFDAPLVANDVSEAEVGFVADDASSEVVDDADTNSGEALPDQGAAENQGSPVVISYVLTGEVDGASREVVEVYNNSQYDTDVTNWCVFYYSSSLTERSVCFLPQKEVGSRVILPARTYAVLASSTFVSAHEGFEPDGVLVSNGLAETQGKILLRDADGTQVDAVGWGGLGALAEGDSVASSPVRGMGLQRQLDGDGVFVDTDNNGHDFMHVTAKTVFETGGLLDLVDFCVNIPGIQHSAPEGQQRNDAGECIAVEAESINLCSGVIISEIAANVDEQFIELVNASEDAVSLAGCQLQTNRSTKTFVFDDDIELGAGEYLTVLVDETGLTLTKTTTGAVYLLSSDGESEVDSTEYKNLLKETSWSRVAGEWRQTYALTPGVGNVYEKYPPCEEGYWRNEETGRCNKVVEPAVVVGCGVGRERNPETGRCRNIPAASVLKPCRDGQYRSEETNRCRSIATAAASVLKPCADDQFRNPLTNRCKKIASAEDVALADCGEGRERNPATNRCRNVLSATMPAVPFAPDEITETAQGMLGWWALGGVSLVALGYAGWQWRFEVGRLARRVSRVFVPGSKE